MFDVHFLSGGTSGGLGDIVASCDGHVHVRYLILVCAILSTVVSYGTPRQARQFINSVREGLLSFQSNPSFIHEIWSVGQWRVTLRKRIRYSIAIVFI